MEIQRATIVRELANCHLVGGAGPQENKLIH